MLSSQLSQEEKLVSKDIEQAETHSEGEGVVTPQLGSKVRNGLISAVVLGCLVLACLHFSGSKVLHSSLTGTQVKAGIYSNAYAAASPASTATFAPAPSPSAYSQAASQATSVAGFDASKIASVNELTGGRAPAAAPTSAAAPGEDMDDGNTCEDDEELWAKLCYKQCTLLTSGEYPARVSSFGCAKSSSFHDLLTNQKIPSMIPCQGFDVSGDEAGNGCPHDEGACREDEEISLGKCYKKCSQLTDGVYPHRTSSLSCCKSTALTECLTPSSVKMSSNFAVGGGSNSREKRVHNPEVKYTESTGVPSPAVSATVQTR